MSAEGRSRIGFTAVLLIIVVIGVSAFVSGRQFLETNAAVTHTVRVQLALAELLRFVVDAETATRGFFITGDEVYLEPYDAATLGIPPLLDELRLLVADNPSQMGRLEHLGDAVEARLDSITATIERRRTMSLDEALAANATPGRGREQMDVIRQRVGEMQADEAQLLAERTAAAEGIASAAAVIYALLTLAAAAMLGVIYALFRHSYAESKRNEAALEQRVTERTSQLQFLSDASSILTEPTAYQQKLGQLVQMAVQQFADVCVIYLAKDPDEATPVLEASIAAHRDPSKLSALYESLAKTPPGPDNSGGVYEVFATGRTMHYADIDALTASMPPDSSRLTGVRALGLKSVILVPLAANGKRLGVLSLFIQDSPRRYTESDMTLAEELADRTGLLIENGRLFARIRQLNADLERRVKERTQQLEAINQELESFNYSISHDLRAPLRSIDGFSQAILEDYGEALPPPAASHLGRVRAAAQRMGELIDDLLGLSRLTRIEMRMTTVDVTKISRSVAEMLKRDNPERDVDISVEEGLTAEGDPQLVRILLENLIENAWKFTNRTANARIEIGQMQIDGLPTFFVRDNGAGFEMAYVDKLFGAFERLHKNTEFEGTGIGLATVQRIVNRHGGKVWAVGTVGEGATFYFRLSPGST